MMIEPKKELIWIVFRKASLIDRYYSIDILRLKLSKGVGDVHGRDKQNVELLLSLMHGGWSTSQSLF